MSSPHPKSWLEVIRDVIQDNARAPSDSVRLAWMRHSIAIGKLWTPPDADVVSEQYGAACGLMALAAVTGSSALAAMQMFPQFNDRRWINRREMRSAIEQLGYAYNNKPEGQWPDIGLGLIHFTGPWTTTAYPARMLQYSHWIGVIGEYVFDVNWAGWLPKANWCEIVLERLLENRPNADGWSLMTGYELFDSYRESGTSTGE